MKNMVIAAAVMVCGFCYAADTKVAVVDMQKALRSHPETERAETVLEGKLKEIEEQRKNVLARLEKLQDEIKDIMEQTQNKALADAKREELRAKAEEKLKELRRQDMEAKKSLDGSNKDLAEQKLGMHKRIVDEISAIVARYADEKGFDIVVDSAGISMSGMPAVVFAKKGMDITEDIVKKVSAAGK